MHPRLSLYSVTLTCGIGLFASGHVLAAWDLGNVCLGFGCDGRPYVGSPWLKDRWEDIGHTPGSVGRICSSVGPAACVDPRFFNVYQALRAGQMAGMYNDVDGCVATGLTLNEGGHQAAQYIALAYGVAIPQEFMEFAKNVNEFYIKGSCEDLFRSQFNQDAIAYYGEHVYGKRSDHRAISDAIKARSSRPDYPPTGNAPRPSGYVSPGYPPRSYPPVSSSPPYPPYPPGAPPAPMSLTPSSVSSGRDYRYMGVETP